MEDLDGKWILAKDTACPEKDASPATLGLPNMAGPCAFLLYWFNVFIYLKHTEVLVFMAQC